MDQNNNSFRNNQGTQFPPQYNHQVRTQGGYPDAGMPPQTGASGYVPPPAGAGYMPPPPSAYAPPGMTPGKPPVRYGAAPGAAAAAEKDGKSPPAGDNAAPSGKKKTSRDYALSLLIKIGATAAALVILLTVFAGVFVCHNNSSYPMIKDGDFCMTSRLSKLVQGDVVAYKDNGTVRFGRIIAFEGDTVEIMNDFIAVNGYGLYDEAVYPTTPEGASVTFPYTVPEGCVFVLNDYRSDISDSRTLGGVPLSDVKGKVIFIMRRRGI